MLEFKETTQEDNIMHPISFGKYLLEKGFTCEYEGDGEDYARYRKHSIEVWYYGRTIKIYISEDVCRTCPTCYQHHTYVSREEVYFNSNTSEEIFKTIIDKYIDND